MRLGWCFMCVYVLGDGLRGLVCFSLRVLKGEGIDDSDGGGGDG